MVDALSSFCLFYSVCVFHFLFVFFRAAFLLAFSGVFKLSELVSPTQSLEGGLLFCNVYFVEDHLLLLSKCSKTEPVGRGRWIRLNCFLGSPLCPVKVLRSYLTIRPDGGLSLFYHTDGSVLSKFSFLPSLKGLWQLQDCLDF